MHLVEALGANRGTICVVGAGGKKTTIFALAPRLPRAVVTATVRIPLFDRRVAKVVVTDDPIEAVKRAHEWPIGVVPERNGDRYEGYDPSVIDQLARANVADAVLVKADGARTRWFKAPGEREPRIPDEADLVVPIASVRIVGERLTEERVHRPERVAALTDLEIGDIIRPVHVATVLASPDGGRKGVPSDAVVTPVLNMVDDEAIAATAREIAHDILDRADVARVVLSRMTDDDPVVAVIESER